MIWNLLLIILLVVILIALFVGVVIVWPQYKQAKPIAPKGFNRKRIKPNDKVVVIFGDSLTQGAISANFVVLLQEQLGPQGYHFVNAGINGDLAYNLLQRIDDVVACKPDYIAILVGTNDAQASSTPEKEAEFIKRKKLPQTPTLDWFNENLNTIVTRLQTELDTSIALLSIGPYGENLASPENKKWQMFNQVIQTIATEKGVAYLPLFESMSDFLASRGPKKAYSTTDGAIDGMLNRAIAVQRPLQRKSYNQIGTENGFDLLSDGLHFNEVGGKMAADLITTWLGSVDI